MNTWMITAALVLFGVLLSTALFFFVFTRGALVLRAMTPAGRSASAHVYPVYSNMKLIKLVDFQPIISAILLFQYHRLVSKIVAEMRQMDLTGKKVLITSCAFGNVIPRVVKAAIQGGAERVLIVDIIPNELDHARSKLDKYLDKVEFIEENAACMKQVDRVAAVNVIFFLLHELPHDLKGQTLNEAGRVLSPGGKLLVGEFHRPGPCLMRVLSWAYFKVYEPLGLALWDTHDPVAYLKGCGGWQCERSTYFFDNFQIITATKQ